MKTVAFFGDSFVGKYQGWVKYFCENYNYKCVHVGKPGADPYYSLEQWNNFNSSDMYQTIDLCVYAHTEHTRLYHPDSQFHITRNFAMDYKKMSKSWTTEQKLIFQAAQFYYTYLDFKNLEELKSQIIPMGIDNYIKLNNKIFKKIIHLWSFAPISSLKINDEAEVPFHDVYWPFEMTSGMNVKLDLRNLSCAEPDQITQTWDSRPNHFSEKYSYFLADVLHIADIFYEKKIIDFSKHITKENLTSWDAYVQALEKIKEEFNANTNNG